MEEERNMAGTRMKRVLIIGCPGSGKSTFARGLHEKTGILLIHLDQIYHLPDRTTVSRLEFDQKLSEILRKEAWILDGNYSRTMKIRLQACDTVFFLDFPLEDCLEGAISRIGKKREDFPWVEAKLDPEFRQFILDFQTKTRPGIYELLNGVQRDIRVVIFHSRREADDYLDHL